MSASPTTGESPGTVLSTTAPTTKPTASIGGRAVVPAPPPGTAQLVVIDPGHNGANGRHPAEINRLVDAGGLRKACNTTGTADGGVTESSVNLAMAHAVGDELTARGYRVLLTRTDDLGWGPCIDERGRAAGDNRAAALVSLHVDGADATRGGFHVITPAASGAVPSDRAAASEALARAMSRSLVEQGLATAPMGRGGVVVRSDLGTLNRAGVPAVMLEAGNLHHPGDRTRLTSTAGRTAIARATAEAIEAQVGRP